MAFVVATKKLSESQKNLLIQSGLEITDYNAIEKYPLDNSTKNLNFPVSAIVSSAYATRLLLEKNPKFDDLYVVGQKSADLLEIQGYQPNYIANYADELADYIIQHHPKNKILYFFCSQQRRDELPDRLKTNGFKLKEIHLYAIQNRPLHFDRTVDAVLFLSPSAVRSFCKANEQRDFIAFCIGKTTAAEADKYQLKTQMANATSYESLIATCVNYFRR